MLHHAVMTNLMWLCSIKPTDSEAVAGGYYRWSTPFDYLDAYQMQLDTGALVNGSCLNSNDTYDMVQCPAGSYKLPEDAIADLCAVRGVPCPPVSPVVCLIVCHAALTWHDAESCWQLQTATRCHCQVVHCAKLAVPSCKSCCCRMMYCTDQMTWHDAAHC